MPSAANAVLDSLRGRALGRSSDRMCRSRASFVLGLAVLFRASHAFVP